MVRNAHFSSLPYIFKGWRGREPVLPRHPAAACSSRGGLAKGIIYLTAQVTNLLAEQFFDTCPRSAVDNRPRPMVPCMPYGEAGRGTVRRGLVRHGMVCYILPSSICAHRLLDLLPQPMLTYACKCGTVRYGLFWHGVAWSGRVLTFYRRSKPHNVDVHQSLYTNRGGKPKDLPPFLLTRSPAME